MTGLPYYLLGRVPCRSVSLVAIVVEATANENRDLYTRKPCCLCRTMSKPIYSGRWYWDCRMCIPPRPGWGSSKRKTGHSLSSAFKKQILFPYPRWFRGQSPRQSSCEVELEGDLRRINRSVYIDTRSTESHFDDKCAERCRGPEVELDHWRQVVALHEKYYFVSEKFVIPSSSSAVAFSAQDIPCTPKSAVTNAHSSASTPSVHSTPSSSASLSSQKSSKDPSVRLNYYALNVIS